MDDKEKAPSIWISIQAEFADIAALAVACDAALARVAEGVPADLIQMLRDRFYTNSRPFKLRDDEVRHLYKALHTVDPGHSERWVLDSRVQSRVAEILRTAWADETGTDDLHSRAMAD